MSDIQDKINKILSDPEALKQLQGLGAQLGLSGDNPVKQPELSAACACSYCEWCKR